MMLARLDCYAKGLICHHTVTAQPPGFHFFTFPKRRVPPEIMASMCQASSRNRRRGLPEIEGGKRRVLPQLTPTRLLAAPCTPQILRFIATALVARLPLCTRYNDSEQIHSRREGDFQ